MALIVLLPDMPDWVRIGLVGLVAVLMLFSFVKYMIIFLHLRREFPKREEPPDPKADSCGRLIRPRIFKEDSDRSDTAPAWIQAGIWFSRLLRKDGNWYALFPLQKRPAVVFITRDGGG